MIALQTVLLGHLPVNNQAMPWPWPPLHHVFRAFDHLSPSQARVEAARMLDGFRKELAVEAVVFGMMVAGLVGVVPCGAMFVGQVSGSGRVHPVFPFLLLTAVAVGYVAGSWRWQRVAAVVLESRLRRAAIGYGTSAPNAGIHSTDCHTIRGV